MSRLRCDVIMAVRNELPHNLEKTVASVVCALGKSDRLTICLDGEQECGIQNGPSVRVITPYKEHLGPGAARHAAIKASKADKIIIVDGHMDFPADFIDVICEHLDANPKDVTCCHMASYDTEWRLIVPVKDFGGCSIAVKKAIDGASGRSYRALSGTWLKQAPESGPIPCIMGACYGMKRKWYAEIGEPLKILRGWGMDEELLSLCSWICGGRAYLLPLRCSHMYAAPNTRNHADDNADERDALVSRFATVLVLPMPDAEKKALHEYLTLNPLKTSTVNDFLAEREAEINELTEHLATKSVMSWDAIKEKVLDYSPPEAPPPVFGNARSSVLLPRQPEIKREPPAVRCQRCDQNTMQRYSDEYNKCRFCGHKQARPRRT